MGKLKTVSFLFNMIEGDFHTSRTYGRDRESDEITASIAAETGFTDNFLEIFGQMLAYTADLRFHWHEGVPDTITAVEPFWKMYRKGVPVAEWFQFYSDNLDNLVITGERQRYELQRVTDTEFAALRAGSKIDDLVVNANGVLFKSVEVRPAVKGWNDAYKEALEVWRPPKEWQLLSALPEDEQSDPLLSNNIGQSVPD